VCFRLTEEAAAAAAAATAAAAQTGDHPNDGAPLTATGSQHSSSQGQPTALTTDEAVQVQTMSRSSLHGTRPVLSPGGSPMSPSGPPPPPVPQLAHSFSSKRVQPSSRTATAGGGVQMTLDVTGSWSDLARQDATLPTDAGTTADKAAPNGGVLGFFGRKRGRTNSPKPKERGVLGKEGARVIIG
jgi:serine/threonine kinase 32